ncbi:MAG: hypothetical protein KJS92_01130 [Bacteroidetes bacterium]|nr:hypothetical protein [Bacteroidota bacterium]
MCTGGIKWGLILLSVACGSTQSGIRVYDDQCRERSVPTKQRTLQVYMSYPYCSGCVEQISALLKLQAGAHHLKPVYLLHYSGRVGPPDCLNGQGILARTRLGYPLVMPAYILKDSAVISGAGSGINLCIGDSLLLPQDSLFNGMQLRTDQVMRFLKRER